MFLVYVLLLVSLPDSSQGDCHCLNGCTNFPGSPCPDAMCQPDWFGSYCQKRNIARGMSTSQSSELQVFGGPYPSDKAVNGNTNQRFDDGSCSHTGNTTSTGEWWRVDINSTLEIRRMRIYLRSDQPDRNVGLRVNVSDQLCYTLSGRQTVLNIDCGEALSGSSVKISVNGPYLTLCEVQIFQCSDGWFGSDCDKQCQCQNTAEICDKETGNCRSGCTAGKQGLGCQQDCGQRHYGVNCSFTCGQCSGSSDCKKDDGTCPQGCQQGYLFPLCKTCIPGRYGEGCLHTCGHCHINGSCNAQTGRCENNCQPGYMGPLCIQECADYTYGINCSGVCSCLNQCEVCHKVTGECRTGHQSTTTAAAGALAAHQGQGYDDIRLIAVSCLLAIACVYAVITTATIYRIRRSMKILKAEQIQQYSTLQVRGESSVYDVIAERSVYANESIQRDGDQDPNKN